jgi:hypothetical protein
MIADGELLTEPVTFGTLRDRHLALMQEWRGIPDEKLRAERAAVFREKIAAAGADIEAVAERDAAQGLIDYWASQIAGLREESYPAPLLLAEYRGEKVPDVARSLEQAYRDSSLPERLQMRKVLENLLVLHDGQVERSRPRDRETLLKTAGGLDDHTFNTVLANLVETGAIVRRSGESDLDDRFEAADPRVAQSWPALAGWLKEAADYNIERDRLVSLAQAWDIAGRPSSKLLRDEEATKDALAFRNEDEVLDDFIEASDRARIVQRRVFAIASSLVILILGAACLWLWQENRRIDALREEAEAKVKMAKAQQDTADRVLQSAQTEAKVEITPDALNETQTPADSGNAVQPGEDGPLNVLTATTGAIWLGSEALPQVRDVKGGGVVNPGQLKVGARVRLRTPTYLRRAMPVSSEDYASPARKGVVPAGGQIILTGPPRGYRRSTGIQYWAEVRAVPQIYVQYNNARRDEIDRIRTALAKLGFEVPPAQEIRGFQGLSEVRYTWQLDQEIATFLQRELQAMPQVNAAGPIGCHVIKSDAKTGSNFKLEFWFDPRRNPARQVRSRC